MNDTITHSPNFARFKTFALTWENASEVKHVATACQMTERQASNLAATLRRRGVPLKRMKAKGGSDPGVRKMSRAEFEELKVLVENMETAREVDERYRGKSPRK